MNMNSRVDGNGNFYAGDLLLGNKHLYSGSRSPCNNSYIQHVGPYGFPMYQPNYNLNSASITQTNQMSVFTNLVHTPSTPSNMVNFGNHQISSLPFLVRDESSSFGKDGVDDFTRMFRDEAPHQQCDELLQSIVDSSCAVNSTPLKEMKNSLKQRNFEIDLNKTPEQRPPKRRQHTPMVSSECKFSDLLNFPLDGGLSLYEEAEENVVTVILDEATQKRHDELLKDFTETLSASISTPCGEIKELKESDQVIDLNKTPEQKPPKRRKHRPKVIKEGKPKRSSKPVMPKDTKETPSGKRKYVRKKIIKEPATPPVNVEEIKDSSTAIRTKSCKRVLNFDSEKNGNEDQGMKQDEKDINMRSFCFVSRPSVSDLCAQSNGVCGTSSDVRISHRYEMMAENMRSTIQSNLAYINQMMIPFRSQSEREAALDPLNKSVYHKVENLRNDRGNLLKDFSSDRSINFATHRNKFQRQQFTHTLYQEIDRSRDSSGLTKFNCNSSPTAVEKCSDLQPFPRIKATEYGYACRHSSDSMLKKRQVSQPISSKLGLLATKEVQQQDYSFSFQQFPYQTTGVLINNIIRRLEDLNLNENERTNMPEKNAIVPYKGNGEIIPLVEPEFIKKRKPRPRVDLDPETERIWNLLMGTEGSEGLQGHEEDKKKWWEEERKVFRGRADSFIAKMHLVQGDRRFSQWKGSVVDSVIGVFLTQNVSDHLSSSAFISLAARFPVKYISDNRTRGEVGKIIVTMPDEPAIYQLFPEDSVRWDGQVPSVPRFALPHTLINKQSHVANSGTGKKLMDVHCQIVEEEVISSQDSLDSTITQGSGGARSCSGSNSEAEDPIVSYNSSSIHFLNFTNAQQMETTTTIQKAVSNLDGSSTFDQASEQKHGPLPDEKHDSLTSEWDEINDLNGHSLFNFLMNIENQQKQAQVAPLNSQLDITPDHGVVEVEGHEALSEESISSGPSVASGFSTEKNMTCRNLNVGKLVRTLGKTRAEENGEARSQETTRTNHSQSVGEHSAHLQSNGIQAESRWGFNHYLDNYDPCERNKTFSLDNVSVTDTSNELVAPAEMQTSASSHVIRAPVHTKKSLDVEDRENVSTSKPKRRKVNGEKNIAVDWDGLRKQVEINGKIKEKTKDTMDSIDYEALRLAGVHEISDAIKERGMNNMLAERIKEFLNRLVTEHGSIDLEWLREVPPDKAKDYLLSVRGLGLKSVECVRLLTLRHLAFPVDTNVGRIAVRLGWVPLQPLPESLQLHLLELYPVLESIQKFLWPRLCKLDQRTLYELHYQLITFGKVFCTKSKPNCNACPMRGECKHFASAFASARLALPAPDERRIVSSTNPIAAENLPAVVISPLPMLPPAEGTAAAKASGTRECEPIVEVPATPEQEFNEISESDIEDAFYEDPDEIPTIKLSMEEFKTTLQNYIPEGDMSKALVALNPEAASIPMPKLKNMSRLRTEHLVYELLDSHPLLQRMDIREPDDPSPYLLAIWTPGETADSIQPPEQSCGSQDPNIMCNEKTCFTCNSRREADSQTVRGTLLIPCRTAMRGSFPLNGTYFQVNEMFADHESSLNPIDVPRTWLWNLPRRTVYFGTSVTSIFKGLSTEGIQQCFWRGFVCVRGFDQKLRAPRPLIARLHFPASKLARMRNG